MRERNKERERERENERERERERTFARICAQKLPSATPTRVREMFMFARGAMARPKKKGGRAHFFSSLIVHPTANA